jgi:hypothetical protein
MASTQLVNNHSCQEPMICSKYSLMVNIPASGRKNSISSDGSCTSASTACDDDYSVPPPCEPRNKVPCSTATAAQAQSTGVIAPELLRRDMNADIGISNRFYFNKSRHVLVHGLYPGVSIAGICHWANQFGQVECINIQRLQEGIALVSFFDVHCARHAVARWRMAGLVASECVPPPLPNSCEIPTCDWVVDFTTQPQANQYVADYLRSRYGNVITWMSDTPSGVLRVEFSNSGIALMARQELRQAPGPAGWSCVSPLSEACMLQSRQLAAYLTGTENDPAGANIQTGSPTCTPLVLKTLSPQSSNASSLQSPSPVTVEADVVTPQGQNNGALEKGTEAPDIRSNSKTNSTVNSTDSSVVAPIEEKNRIDPKPEMVKKDGRLSLIICNIPSKYTRKTLIKELDVAKTCDYFYLPINKNQKKKSSCNNAGYAFISFTDAAAVARFCARFQGARWKRFNSSDKCEMSYAPIQIQSSC